MNYFDRRPNGEVLSRITNDIDTLGRLAKQEEEKNNCLENIKTNPKVSDISNTFMNCSIITELPRQNS